MTIYLQRKEKYSEVLVDSGSQAELPLGQNPPARFQVQHLFLLLPLFFNDFDNIVNHARIRQLS